MYHDSPEDGNSQKDYEKLITSTNPRTKRSILKSVPFQQDGFWQRERASPINEGRKLEYEPDKLNEPDGSPIVKLNLPHPHKGGKRSGGPGLPRGRELQQ